MKRPQINSGGKNKGKVHAYVAGGSVGNIPAFQAGGTSNHKPFAEMTQQELRDYAMKKPYKQLQVSIAEEDRKTSLASARKAGHLYYWKNGQKMAAVSAEDLDKTGLSLRDFMNQQLGKTRKARSKVAPVPREKPRRKPAEITLSEDAIEAGRKAMRSEREARIPEFK